VHRHIPHNSLDRSPIDRSEKPTAPYEKRIIALHNVLISKGHLPGLDPIRRAAEQVDGQFASGQLPDNIPKSLSGRQPTYGERRLLAVEAALSQVGLIQEHELKQEKLDTSTPISAQAQDAVHPISLKVVDQTALPQFQAGDWVRVQTNAKLGHIRTPLYLLGKRGIVSQVQGIFKNPEEMAHLLQPVRRLYLYLVEFEMQEIWGELCPGSAQRDTLTAELYEHWLSPN